MPALPAGGGGVRSAAEDAELLEASGVGTVKGLARRNAEHLTAKMTDVNETEKLVRPVATESEVERWVDEAKTLPRVVEY